MLKWWIYAKETEAFHWKFRRFVIRHRNSYSTRSLIVDFVLRLRFCFAFSFSGSLKNRTKKVFFHIKKVHVQTITHIVNDFRSHSFLFRFSLAFLSFTFRAALIARDNHVCTGAIWKPYVVRNVYEWDHDLNSGFKWPTGFSLFSFAPKRKFRGASGERERTKICSAGRPLRASIELNNRNRLARIHEVFVFVKTSLLAEPAIDPSHEPCRAPSQSAAGRRAVGETKQVSRTSEWKRRNAIAQYKMRVSCKFNRRLIELTHFFSLLTI